MTVEKVVPRIPRIIEPELTRTQEPIPTYEEPELSPDETASIHTVISELTEENAVDHEADLMEAVLQGKADSRIRSKLTEIIRRSTPDEQDDYQDREEAAIRARARLDEIRKRELEEANVVRESLRKINAIENEEAGMTDEIRVRVMNAFHDLVKARATEVSYREAFNQVSDAFISFSEELTK